MSRIIAIANQKGGVGKTTTTVNLAAALASMQKRVLLIDLDPQGNATMGCGIDKHDFETGIFDVLVDDMPVSEACQTQTDNGCHVLPANADLTAAEVELMGMEAREQRLHRALDKARDDYEFILIDCPPSLNILTLNAFVAADSVLVPVQCEYYALEGLSALLETIDGVRESVNPDLAIEGLLRTMYDGRNRLGNEVSAQLIDHFGDQVFRTVVPRNIRLAEAPSHGISIMDYDSTSRGALAYLALAGEVVRNADRAAASDSGASGHGSPAAGDEQSATDDASSGVTSDSDRQDTHDADATPESDDARVSDADAPEAATQSASELPEQIDEDTEHLDIGIPASSGTDDNRAPSQGFSTASFLKTNTESADG